MKLNTSFWSVKKIKMAGIPIILTTLLGGCSSVHEAKSLHQTGTVAFMLNYDKAASNYFERAIQNNPEYGPSYIMLGDCYIRDKKYHKALEVLNQGILVGLDQGQERLTHRKLARAYKETNQPKKAIDEIKIYSYMSIDQKKFDENTLERTQKFITELDLSDDVKKSSIEEIIERTKVKPNSKKEEKEEESMFSFIGL